MTLKHPPSKKALIKTWGCQMNVYDSERIEDVLDNMGYLTTEDPQQADLVVLNTCHIREKASEKIYSDLGRLRETKEQRAKSGMETKIAVVGCVAQAEGAEILSRAPVVDMVLGPQSYQKLPEMLAKTDAPRQEQLATGFDVDEKFASLPKGRKPSGPAAFLTVQEGCDKFCTFCVVPYTRGAEHSRTADAVLAEARELVDAGVCEITLLGQNVNAWQAAAPKGTQGTWQLGELLEALSQIKGIERLRYTTSHPRDMNAELIAAHGSNPKLMPYLHLPVQSGSNRILKAMNRDHRIETYLEQIRSVRAVRPDIAISGDFIVGFPGETDADVEDTMACVREVGYASAYSFLYSARPGTPGATLGDQIPKAIASARLQVLQALLQEQQLAFNQAQLGKVLPILLERKGRHGGQLGGRSPYLQSVHVEAPENLLGQLVRVKITAASARSLTGEPMDEVDV